MDDYIRREAALEAVCADCSVKMRLICKLESNYCKKYNAVKSVPAADVRPVVLCRDCENAKHWYSDKFLCYLWSESGIDVFADGFCSYGKRRGAEMGGTP